MLAAALLALFQLHSGRAAAQAPACPSGEAELLAQAFEKPALRQRGKIYLVDTPFLRVESETPAFIRFIVKSAHDGVAENSLGYLRAVDGVLSKGLGKLELPLRPADARNCLIARILAKGLARAVAPQDVELAEAIHAVKARRDALEPQADAQGAIMIGQARAGSASAPQRIGTTGLGPCIAAAVYSPRVKRAAVAHFDPNLSTADLANELFAPFGGERELQVSVVGGWTGMSERSLYYLRKELEKRGARTTTEDALGENVARGLVLDAETGKVTALTLP